MSTNKALTVGQIIALNHTMTEYPQKYDLDTIFNMIHLGAPDVVIYSFFDNWDTNDLYDFVNCLAEDIDKELELAMR